MEQIQRPSDQRGPASESVDIFARASPTPTHKEFVRVRPLTREDVEAYFNAADQPGDPQKPPAVSAVKAERDAFAARVRAERSDIFPGGGRVIPAVLAILAAYLLEKMFKFFAAKLRAVAEKYHAEMTGAAFGPRFWIPNSGRSAWEMKYIGFEFRREKIATDPSGAQPSADLFASSVADVDAHIIFLFCPGEDKRYMQLKPVFFRINMPRAKTATRSTERGAIRVAVGATMSLNIPSREHIGASESASAFDFAFTVENYLPGNGRPRKRGKTEIEGDPPGMALTTVQRLGIASEWFAIPQPPYAPPGPDAVFNPFSLRVEVAETDLSRAAEVFEIFADMLDDNRAEVSAVIKERINPPK